MLANFGQGIFLRPEREFEVGFSVPPYPKKESGAVLIVGTAPCWHDDYIRAKKKYPDADVCALNEAAALVDAKHFATCHGEKLDKFMGMHARAWESQFPITHIKDKPEAAKWENVYRWTLSTGAGSAPFAAALMITIGYDLAIFVGCPMNGGGGYAMETHKSTPDDPRFGMLKENHSMVLAWKDALRQMKEKLPGVVEKWRSMSGYTQDLFGGIE